MHSALETDVSEDAPQSSHAAPRADHATAIRVRYCETDAMGYLHHGEYANYFEVARTELLRAQGGCYADLEKAGYFLVVAELNTKFHRPARYDDELSVVARTVQVSPVKLVHEYRVERAGELLTSGRSVLACVDRDGRIQRMPDDVVAAAKAANG